MQTNLKYKGMTRVPSDHDNFQGELEEVYNLVNKNGELRPVVAPDEIGTVPGELLFVHKTASFEHFISLVDAQLKAFVYANNQITPITERIINIFAGEKVLKIESVGNTLIILTSTEVIYCLWKDDKYLNLGNSIPFPNIHFNLQTSSVSDQNYKQAPFGDAFDEDFEKIRREGGSNRGREISGYGNLIGLEAFMQSTTGSTSGSSTTHNRQPSTTPINSDYQRISSGQIVSDDFQNSVKGAINSRIEKIAENKAFLFPFFVRYAIRLYDGTLIKHSQPFLMLPSKFLPFQAGIMKDTSKFIYVLIPNISKLVYSHASISNLKTDFSDIIEGIDVFISSSIYTYLYDGSINGGMRNPYYDATKTNSPELLFGGIYKTKKDILKDIANVSNFYKVATIKLEELVSPVSNKLLEVENINTIENQEPMTDDYYTHDHIKAENSFVYNERLHLTGIEREAFAGFRYSFPTKYISNKEALIDVGNQPFLFYPGKHPNITLESSRINQGNLEYAYKTLPMSNHTGLNGTYYLDPELNDISFSGATFGPRVLIYSTTNQGKYSEQNKLYVSEVQNPFVFPVNSRLTLPVGKILAVSSNTQAISTGQFGQFPLYAFTDDGIWVLEINTQGQYMARQPVSREVCTNPKVMQMDSHISFITAKGLTILSGADTECISEIISDNNTRASKLDIAPFFDAVNVGTLKTVYADSDIELFLKDCHLAYEYINGSGRIFAINGGYPYSYVFDILSKTWSKVKSDYKRAVNNYPDCYVQSANGSIKNLSTIGSSKAAIRTMFITRPITYEDNLFNIRALVHRGIFTSPLNTVIYGSRNGVDYVPVASSSKFHLRSIGTPFRYFKYGVVAYLFPHEALSGVHLDVEARYNNRLR